MIFCLTSGIFASGVFLCSVSLGECGFQGGDVFAYSFIVKSQVIYFIGAIGADGRYWYILVVLFLWNISLVMRRKVFYGICVAQNSKNSLYGQKNAVFDDIVKSVVALDCVFYVF